MAWLAERPPPPRVAERFWRASGGDRGSWRPHYSLGTAGSGTDRNISSAASTRLGYLHRRLLLRPRLHPADVQHSSFYLHRYYYYIRPRLYPDVQISFLNFKPDFAYIPRRSSS